MEVITVTELKALLDLAPGEIALVDVRNPADAEFASIKGSHFVPLASLESGEAIDRVRAFAEGRRLLMHCKLGGRSARAVELLRPQGIAATNVTGGIDAWSQQVDPGIPRY